MARAFPPSLIQSSLPLYGLAAVQALAPLLTVPLLARRLGPDAFGLVFTAQSLAGWAAIAIEYGFTYSAARVASARRDDRASVAQLVGDVAGARACLSAVGVVLLLLAWQLVPAWRSLPAGLWLGACALMLAQGNMFLWCLQGIEAAGRAVPVALASRLLALGGIAAVVHGPSDASLALAVLAASASLETFGQAVRLRGLIGGWRPGFARVGAMLREGGPLAANRLVYAFLTSGNVALMAAFTAPMVAGPFAAAERLVGYAIQGLAPVSTALFVRSSHLVAQDPNLAARHLRTEAPRLVGAMTGLALLISAFSGAITAAFLGPQFRSSGEILTLLAWIMPLHAVHYALGPGWLIARHRDRTYARCIAVSAGLNLIGAAILTPRYGGLGMAVSLVISLTVLAGSLALAVRQDLRALTPPNSTDLT